MYIKIKYLYNKMLYKLTHELLYILVDLFSIDAMYKIQGSDNRIIVGNYTIRHYYAKMYYVNNNVINKTYNFRDFWQFLQTISLNIKCITIGSNTHRIVNSYIDLPPLKNVSDTLLLYANKTGTQDNDIHTIRTIIHHFNTQNNL